MENDVEAITERVRTTPPSCLSGFRCTPTTLPEPWDNNPCSVWKVTCLCGSTTGRLLGYPLREVRSDYDDPEYFVSPLAFECGLCEAVTELLDTEKHGYHAMLGCSSMLRGRGRRRAYGCPGCGSEYFHITVGFVFWHVDELALFDSAWEDRYNVFVSYSRCVTCGELDWPTNFGKL